jgi:pyruvate dehydrogenase E2 component (dihydrolipoamide acetyltransferase)
MIEFRLPALGADMDEGTLLEWKVKPGERVKKGQVIAVVDTAKAAIDVECWQDGIVHQLIAEPGQKLPVGALMATLLEEGEKVGAGEAAPPAAAAPIAATPPERRRISPAARKRAAELGVDLERIPGSGPQGAVTLEDVEKAAARPRRLPAPRRRPRRAISRCARPSPRQ